MSDDKENTLNGVLEEAEVVSYEPEEESYVENILQLPQRTWSPFTLAAIGRYLVLHAFPPAVTKNINIEAVSCRTKLYSVIQWDSQTCSMVRQFRSHDISSWTDIPLQTNHGNHASSVANEMIYATVPIEPFSDIYDVEGREILRKLSAYVDLWMWIHISCTLIHAYRDKFVAYIGRISNRQTQHKFMALRTTTLMLMSHGLAVKFWSYVFKHLDDDYEYLDDITRFLQTSHLCIRQVCSAMNGVYINELHLSPRYTSEIVVDHDSLFRANLATEKVYNVFAGRSFESIDSWISLTNRIVSHGIGPHKYKRRRATRRSESNHGRWIF